MSESASDSLAALKKLKVAELREQLSAIGLPTNGLKSDLVDRLFKALHPEQTVVDSQNEAVKNVTELATPRAPTSPVKNHPAPKSPSKTNSNPVNEEKEKAETALSANELQDLKRKRAERFGVAIPESSSTNEKPEQKHNSKLDGPLGSKKRGRQEIAAPKLNLSDPDVQKRLNRFGVQTHDPNSIVAKSVAVEEAKRKKEERLKKFGSIVRDETPDVAEFHAAIAARKARFDMA